MTSVSGSAWIGGVPASARTAGLFRPYGLMDYFGTSLEAGLRGLRRDCLRAAVGRIVNPLSYPRYLEYQLTVNQLGVRAGHRVLDVGSPKLPILLLARRTHCELYATDLRDDFIAPTRRFLAGLGLSHRQGRGVHLETQDARQLTYPNAWFDRIYSISVLEHIPDDGDRQAIRELARVLKPGGVLTLTVPVALRGYREEHVRGAVFGRAAGASRTFYQRRYDLGALRSRLIEPSGLTLTSEVFFGEPGLRFEPYWNRVSLYWKAPLLWLQPFLARLLLRPLRPERWNAACGGALRLVKAAV